MLKNAYLDAEIGVDPAENEPRKEWLRRGPLAPEPAGAVDAASQAPPGSHLARRSPRLDRPRRVSGVS